MTATKVTYYKDLSNEDEKELVLWLAYFEESVNNSLTQKRRWKRNMDNWDLQMFFVAVRCIYEATEGLMNLRFFCNNEPGIWKAMSSFRRYFDGTSLKDLRDESIHRDQLYNRKSKQKRPLQVGSLIILGGLIVNSNEYVYQNGVHKIKVLETFQIIEALAREIRLALDKRIKKNPDPMTYNKGMIPWMDLRSFIRRKRRHQFSKDLLKYGV
ncbi:MAG: hypothetical protein HYW45_03310 [Candidatus Daviesbacteria bacterium]|nr:MAG: hypothetical protein HYW45_03310 [Candidatus Daviesbacteria bacterium]